MSTLNDREFNKQVARALAASEHLRIDPKRLEDVPGFSLMVGGFGTVRVAKLDDQIMAIKELRITGAPEDRVRFSIRFARELKVWSRLDHPNLLKLSGFYMDPDISIAQFISPFYVHGHIRNYIDINQPDSAMRLSLAADTAKGLEYLHENKIVHGDLKELNVLVHPAPMAVLCDYGLAKMVDSDSTEPGLTTGSQPISTHFASPELVDGSRPDFASDIWAWGCLFLKIISDVGPYQGTTNVACMTMIAEGVPPADVSTLALSEIFGGMLKQCWDEDPSTRPSIIQCKRTIDYATRLHRSVPLWDVPLWDDSSQVSMKILEIPDYSAPISIAFSPDGSLVASVLSESGVHLWDVDSGMRLNKLDRPDARNDLRAATFSFSGQSLVCGTKGGRIVTWDAVLGNAATSHERSPSWKLNRNMTLSTTGIVQCIAFSPDDLLIAVGCDAGSGVYHVRDGGLWELLFNVEGCLWGATFSPTSRWLASWGENKVVRIWDTAIPIVEGILSEGRVVVELEQHVAWVNSAACSPDGWWLATGSSDRSAIIWDVSSWKPTAMLSSKSFIMSLAFSPDSARLASGAFNGTIQLWNTKSWTSVMTLEGHNPGFIRVAFSPDGNRIASASDDMTVRIWHAKPATVTPATPIISLDVAHNNRHSVPGI